MNVYVKRDAVDCSAWSATLFCRDGRQQAVNERSALTRHPPDQVDSYEQKLARLEGPW